MLQLWLVNLLHGEWRVPTKFILGCKTYKPNLDFLKKGSLLSTHVLNLMPKNHVVFHIIKKKKKSRQDFSSNLNKFWMSLQRGLKSPMQGLSFK